MADGAGIADATSMDRGAAYGLECATDSNAVTIVAGSMEAHPDSHRMTTRAHLAIKAAVRLVVAARICLAKVQHAPLSDADNTHSDTVPIRSEETETSAILANTYPTGRSLRRVAAVPTMLPPPHSAHRAHHSVPAARSMHRGATSEVVPAISEETVATSEDTDKRQGKMQQHTDVT